MVLGLLIAAALAGLLAAYIWHATNDSTQDEDAGLVAGTLGWFAGTGMFIALLVLAVLLLVGAGVAWVVSLF